MVSCQEPSDTILSLNAPHCFAMVSGSSTILLSWFTRLSMDADWLPELPLEYSSTSLLISTILSYCCARISSASGVLDSSW